MIRRIPSPFITPLHVLFLISSSIAIGCGAPGSLPLDLPSTPPAAERLYQDVSWLADDAREGRRAGMPGELLAAHWIAERLQLLGAQPLGTQGYLQAFPVPLPAQDLGGSFVGLGGDTGGDRYEGEAQVAPLFCSAAGTVKGPLLFCGYGIAADDHGWNDFGESRLDGAVCVIVRGTPPRDELRGEGALFQKVMEAKRRGAAAVLIAQHPGEEDPLPGFDSARGAKANIPALMITTAVLEGLFSEYRATMSQLDLSTASAPPQQLVELVTVRADISRKGGTAHNVLARIPGRGQGATVLVGAHFDHLGRGGPGSLAADGGGQIHNGADDNASGTAVCLELARILMNESPAGDVIIALWSGEELGLLGSEYWARAPTMDLSELAMNINLDMVGRAESANLNVLGAGTAEQFVTWLNAAAPRAGLELEINLSGQGVGGSDHQTFIKRDIPALHLFSGLHADYHRPTDDIERFEARGAAQVTTLTLELLARAQAADSIAWTPPAKSDAPEAGSGTRSRGFKTRFGSVPDYSFSGKGLRLDGTSPGGPAEKAGLLRGDVIYAIDDVDVEGMGEFMYVLNSHKPGDVVTVRFERDGKRESVPLTLESAQAE